MTTNTVLNWQILFKVKNLDVFLELVKNKVKYAWYSEHTINNKKISMKNIIILFDPK